MKSIYTPGTFTLGLLFGVKLDSNEPRLLSLGKDRTLVPYHMWHHFDSYTHHSIPFKVEYDLVSSEVDCLKIVSNDCIEQSATPMALTWYPPLTKESFITVVNDQVFSPNNVWDAF